jgi:hypothetical protein
LSKRPKKAVLKELQKKTSLAIETPITPHIVPSKVIVV